MPFLPIIIFLEYIFVLLSNIIRLCFVLCSQPTLLLSYKFCTFPYYNRSILCSYCIFFQCLSISNPQTTIVHFGIYLTFTSAVATVGCGAILFFFFCCRIVEYKHRHLLYYSITIELFHTWKSISPNLMAHYDYR